MTQPYSAPPNSDEVILTGTGADFASQVLQASAEKPVAALFYNPDDAAAAALTQQIQQAVLGASKACQLVLYPQGSAVELAEQLQVGHAPALFIFRKGRPEDGFFGLPKPEQLALLLARFAGTTSLPALEEAQQALTDGDLARAASLFAQLLQTTPNHPQALAGLAETYLAQDDSARAQALLQTLEDDSHPAIAAVRAKLALATKAPPTSDAATLQQQSEANPADHAIRFELALALNRNGDKEGAAAALLAILQAKPDWRDGAARSQLLELFQAWGAEDAATIAARRQLANLLFR